MHVEQNRYCIYNQTHWGPQKIFGGPHAARGPQFGHPWSTVYGSDFINVQTPSILFVSNHVQGYQTEIRIRGNIKKEKNICGPQIKYEF